MQSKLRLRRGDIALCAAAVVSAVLIIVFTAKSDGGKAEIIIKGETVYSCELAKAQNDTLTYGNVTIEIKDGEIGFVSSDCGGHDCVKTGFISKPGETSACIPNGILIKISGGGAKLPDAVSY